MAKPVRIVTISQLLLLFNTIVSIDVTQWLTGSLTTTQGILLLAAGVGIWRPAIIENVYNNCWENQIGRVFIFNLQCAKSVGRAWATLFANASALGYLTRSYKGPEVSHHGIIRKIGHNDELIYMVQLVSNKT